MKYRSLAFGLSLAIIVAFFGMAAYRYHAGKDVFNYSVDFTGGTQVLLKFNKSTDAETAGALPDAAMVKTILE
jgi:preprotein translocase subunit SecF